MYVDIISLQWFSNFQTFIHFSFAPQLQRVDRELKLRQSVRRLTFGHPDGALPLPPLSAPTELNRVALNARNLVDAGLEHPWIGALLTYRDQLAAKVSELSHRDELNRHVVPTKRQVSNLQVRMLVRSVLSGSTPWFVSV